MKLCQKIVKFSKTKVSLTEFCEKAKTKIRDFYKNDPNFDKSTTCTKKLFGFSKLKKNYF